MKCGLLSGEAGKGRPLDLGRMFANDAKSVYEFIALLAFYCIKGPRKAKQRRSIENSSARLFLYLVLGTKKCCRHDDMHNVVGGVHQAS